MTRYNITISCYDRYYIDAVKSENLPLNSPIKYILNIFVHILAIRDTLLQSSPCKSIMLRCNGDFAAPISIK